MGSGKNDHPEIPGVTPELRHLRISAREPMPRRRPKSGGSSKVSAHPDHVSHAKRLEKQVEDVITGLMQQRKLGLNPRAILVVELNRPVRKETWERVDWIELDGTALRGTVAFSTEPDMQKFISKLRTFQRAEQDDEGNATYADLFDAIDEIRPYGPGDRISESLRNELDAPGPDDEILVDISVWYPGGEERQEEAYQWLAIVRSKLDSLGGITIKPYVSHEAGLLLLRARISHSAITALAETDEISSIDLTAKVPSNMPHLPDVTVRELPAVERPPEDAPMVALIDSGINAGHPLLRDSIYESLALLPNFEDGADEHGHGTAVAGVILHGHVSDWWGDGRLQPEAKMLSIRVLDEHNNFPLSQMWVETVTEAVEHAVERGCRIVNLSIGNRDIVLGGKADLELAPVLDQLIRKYGIVVVVPAGNISDVLDYLAFTPDPIDDYVKTHLDSDHTRLLDPAPAALALTVGGIAGPVGRLEPGEQPVGFDGMPSAITRRGPGLSGALKPELSAVSGTVTKNDHYFASRAQALPLLCSHLPDEIFTRMSGTSFAAPYVTHVAGKVLATYPSFSGPLVRALVLQSASNPKIVERLFPERERPTERTRDRVSLVGYGTPDTKRARFSRPERVVLVAEGEIEADSVIVFEVPLPTAFFISEAPRSFSLAVCFDPLTRYKRRHYLATGLFAQLYVGATVDYVKEQAVDLDLDTKTDDYGLEPSDDLGVEENGAAPKPVPIKLEPTMTASSHGANQLLRGTRKQKFNSELPQVAHLALRSIKRWGPDGLLDRYGLALTIQQHEGAYLDIYSEIEQRIEIEPGIEVETELRLEAD